MVQMFVFFYVYSVYNFIFWFYFENMNEWRLEQASLNNYTYIYFKSAGLISRIHIFKKEAAQCKTVYFAQYIVRPLSCIYVF